MINMMMLDSRGDTFKTLKNKTIHSTATAYSTSPAIPSLSTCALGVKKRLKNKDLEKTIISVGMYNQRSQGRLFFKWSI